MRSVEIILSKISTHLPSEIVELIGEYWTEASLEHWRERHMRGFEKVLKQLKFYTKCIHYDINCGAETSGRIIRAPLGFWLLPCRSKIMDRTKFVGTPDRWIYDTIFVKNGQVYEDTTPSEEYYLWHLMVKGQI